MLFNPKDEIGLRQLAGRSEKSFIVSALSHAFARAPKSRIAHGIVEHAIALAESKPRGANVTPIKQVL